MSRISIAMIKLPSFINNYISINARRTIDTSLKLGIIPIVNENDTIATTEIRYGDNDRLAASLRLIADGLS